MLPPLDASSLCHDWHRDFPRLAELRDAVPSQPGTFFYAIPDAVSSDSPFAPLAREAYQELESDLASVDEPPWSAFKAKLLGCDLRSHGHRGYRGIHSVLYESKGYRYLKGELGRRAFAYDQIHLVQETSTPTPEWAAMSRDVPVAALEVKTVYESDDESMYVYENTRRIRRGEHGIVRRADPQISDALWEKLRRTVGNAKTQLYSYAPERAMLRIAFLVVHFDHELTLCPSNYAKVASFLDGLGDQMFQVAYQFRGLNAPTN